MGQHNNYSPYLNEMSAELAYRECLDSEGDVTIAGISKPPSVWLERSDYIAYRNGFVDWLDSQQKA